MPLKVQVELHIQAITCPGVFLPEKDDLFLSISMLGQWKETECLPPVFPLLFHEKMKFEKIYPDAIDPAAVVELLESDTAKFELTQLTPPVGEYLAFYEENTREFLYPEPKLTPSYPGAPREVLMKTVCSFPGIAPKIEFSTRTAIKELSSDLRKRSYVEKKACRRRSNSVSTGRRSSSRRKSRTESRDKDCEETTEPSQPQSPAKDPRRSLAKLYQSLQELTELNQLCLELKANRAARPPFVVSHAQNIESYVRPVVPSPSHEESGTENNIHIHFEKATESSRSPSLSPFFGLSIHMLHSNSHQQLSQLSQGTYELKSSIDARRLIPARHEQNSERCVRPVMARESSPLPEESKTENNIHLHFEKAAEPSRSPSHSPFSGLSMQKVNSDSHQQLPQLSQGSHELKSSIDARPPIAARHEQNKECGIRPVILRKGSPSLEESRTKNNLHIHFEKAAESSRSPPPSSFPGLSMHEPNSDSHQQLSQLSQGSRELKSSIDARPPSTVRHQENKARYRRSTSASPAKRSSSATKSQTKNNDKHFEKATKASTSRSPSPYTRRRMCERNNKNQERLSQLNLGAFKFKSDVDARPPFVVRHVDQSKPVGEKSSSQLRPRNSRRHSRSRSNSFGSPVRGLSFDSNENTDTTGKVPMDIGELDSSEWGSSSLDSEEFMSFPENIGTRRSPLYQFTSSPSILRKQKAASPVSSGSLWHQSRHRSNVPTWETIHERVKNLLTSHRAKQRLICGATSAEIDDVLSRKSISLRTSPNIS